MMCDMLCSCLHGKENIIHHGMEQSTHLARNVAALAAEELRKQRFGAWLNAKQTNINERRRIIMAILEGKKAIIIGDRDGIPGPAIAECVQTAGAEVVFSSTECFV